MPEYKMECDMKDCLSKAHYVLFSPGRQEWTGVCEKHYQETKKIVPDIAKYVVKDFREYDKPKQLYGLDHPENN